MKRLSLSLFSIIYCAYSFAADTATIATAKVVNPANVVPVNLLQITISLFVIGAIVIGLAVAFKKLGLNRMNSALPIKVIGATHIGNNQRIMVIEAGEEWVVIGVTPQHISTLTTIPRQETLDSNTIRNSSNVNQPAWLKNIVKKYQGKADEL